MSQTVRHTEELSVLKLFFTTFLAIDASLIAWLAQNYRVVETTVLVGGLALAVGATVSWFYVAYRIHLCLEQLEKR